jgi:hypothetical protein
MGAALTRFHRLRKHVMSYWVTPWLFGLGKESPDFMLMKVLHKPKFFSGYLVGLSQIHCQQ